MAEFLFKLSSAERKIFEIISGEAIALGSPAYAVGGYVRDKLIGRPSKDIDIVCVGDAIRLASAVASRFRPIPQVNYFSRFGTAMIRHHDLEIEFVGARKESYVEDSRKPDISPGTLEDDQLRRDFSINAISISLNPDDFGELIDPFNGLEDLNHQVIRTPNNPDITFSDDPLRMMRAIRFASQLGYQIEEKTWQGIRRNIDRIKIISKERISSELEKIILSPVPSVGFKLLFDCGLLHIIFPELVALQGVEHQEGKRIKIIFITRFRYWIMSLPNQKISGYCGVHYYMILQNRKPKSLSRAQDGPFMGMMHSALPWCQGFSGISSFPLIIR